MLLVITLTGMYVSGLWGIGRAHFFLLLLVPGIMGWGDEGHYATCKIAQVSEHI